MFPSAILPRATPVISSRVPRLHEALIDDRLQADGAAAAATAAGTAAPQKQEEKIGCGAAAVGASTTTGVLWGCGSGTTGED